MMTKTMRRLAATAAVSAAVLAGCGSDAANEGDPTSDGSTSPNGSGASDDRIQGDDYQGIRWEPLPRYADGKPTEAHVRFRDDGTWTGTDNCNGQSGRYTLSDDGDLTAKPNLQTLIACPGLVDINGALATSNRMVVENDRLTLYDGDKVVLVFTAAPAQA